MSSASLTFGILFNQTSTAFSLDFYNSIRTSSSFFFVLFAWVEGIALNPLIYSGFIAPDYALMVYKFIPCYWQPWNAGLLYSVILCIPRATFNQFSKLSPGQLSSYSSSLSPPPPHDIFKGRSKAYNNMGPGESQGRT